MLNFTMRNKHLIFSSAARRRNTYALEHFGIRWVFWGNHKHDPDLVFISNVSCIYIEGYKREIDSHIHTCTYVHRATYIHTETSVDLYDETVKGKLNPAMSIREGNSSLTETGRGVGATSPCIYTNPQEVIYHGIKIR